MHFFFFYKETTIQACKPGASFQGKNIAFLLKLIGFREVSISKMIRIKVKVEMKSWPIVKITLYLTFLFELVSLKCSFLEGR